MDLKYALNEISENINNTDGYQVRVLKDYEKARSGLPIEEFNILDIDIEHEAKEITLLTDEGSESSEVDKLLAATDLISVLTGLMPKHKDYILFSGSKPIEMGGGYYGRHDNPSIAIGFDEENKVLAFVQESNKNS